MHKRVAFRNSYHLGFHEEIQEFIILDHSYEKDIATGFIPLSPLSVVSTMVMWECSQWFGKNIVRSACLKNSSKAWIDTLAAAI